MPKTGGLEIRLLEESDLPAALRLKELARWNQTERDWLRLLHLEPRGCFCATMAGRVVGTTTTTTYGNELAWVGMVLVDPEYRRRGIATRLMQAALDYLDRAGIRAVKLDATPDGRPVYEKLGFEFESLIERWAGVATTGNDAGCITLNGSAKHKLFMLDRCAFVADRSSLMEMLIEEACVKPCVTLAPDGGLNGYALARSGNSAVYVGPLVTAAAETAGALLDGVLNQLGGQQIYFDVNTNFKTGRELLAARGLVKQRDLFRMCRGKQSEAGSSASVFAIAGPEFG